MQTKQERARKWVNGYAAVGTGVVIAAAIPGSTSAALCAMEAHMCYQVGKIYRDGEYSLAEAKSVARAIGLAAVTGKLLALEALNFAPGLGTIAKAGVAGGVIKTLGEAIIRHYEKQMNERLEIGTAPGADAIARTKPLSLLPANAESSKASAEQRLSNIAELLKKKLISEAQYNA